MICMYVCTCKPHTGATELPRHADDHETSTCTAKARTAAAATATAAEEAAVAPTLQHGVSVAIV